MGLPPPDFEYKKDIFSITLQPLESIRLLNAIRGFLFLPCQMESGEIRLNLRDTGTKWAQFYFLN